MQANRVSGRVAADTTAEACASAVLETSMLVMRAVRRELWRGRPVELTLPQLRGLACAAAHPEASLSDVAAFVGLTLPGTSRLVGALVRRGLLSQGIAARDRRRAALRLTPRGHAALVRARAHTRRHLAALLSALEPSDRVAIARVMRKLAPLFAPPRPHGGRTHAR